MRSPFIIAGIVLIACASNIQAMGAAQENEREHYSDIGEMKQALAQEMKKLMGTDETGKQISINLKTDKEIQTLAQHMGKVMVEKDFEPAFYHWAALDACTLALPVQDFEKFNANTESFRIFCDEIENACQMAKPR